LWKSNPNQVINAGISEANAMGVAAGLSAGGFKPYIHTFGSFATRRCFDQSFLSVGFAKNSVRIFGSDAGVTAAFNGGTHMSLEDMALMRAIPHSTVIEISDSSMLRWVIRAVRDRSGLTYVRTTRKTYSKVYSANHIFEIGKGEILREGEDVTIMAAGLMVGEALKAAEMLSSEDIRARVVDMFSVKPIDDDLVRRCAAETDFIVTAENHNSIGGLGDAVLGSLAMSGLSVKAAKIGVNEEFGSVGPQDYLQKIYGLTAEQIVKTVKSRI
jgi:transketolase